MIARVFDGKPEGLSRDDVLDNITLYWLTNTAISSARLYWDTTHNLPAGGFFDARGVKLPVAVSAFAEEIYQAPKSWAEKAYAKLIHYNRHPKGTPLRGLGTACALRVPVKSRRGNRRICQPIQRDVVEYVVLGPALPASHRWSGDHFLTAGVVIHYEAARPTGESTTSDKSADQAAITMA